MIKNVALLLTVAILLFVSCENNKEELLYPDGTAGECNGVTSKFSTDVLPLIQDKCQGCHGTGSTDGPGALTSYGQIKANTDRIRAAVINRTMPKDGTLTAEQIKTIVCWIDAGAENN